MFAAKDKFRGDGLFVALHTDGKRSFDLKILPCKSRVRVRVEYGLGLDKGQDFIPLSYERF